MPRKSKTELLKWDEPVVVGEPEKGRKSRNTVTTAGVDSMNREVLNSIFPPNEYTEDGVAYTQSVSAAAVSKADVQKLKTQLETLLHNRRARMTGICPIRSGLYSECFDEIIRQVTIECNPRGRLLVRIRDHYKMMVQSYCDLYENTLDWGSRKSKQVNLGIQDLRFYNTKLKEERRKLELEANDLQIQLDSLEKRLQENKAIRDKEHADELAYLKRQGQMLKSQIDQILATK